MENRFCCARTYGTYGNAWHGRISGRAMRRKRRSAKLAWPPVRGSGCPGATPATSRLLLTLATCAWPS